MKEFALRFDKNGTGDIRYDSTRSIMVDENNLNSVFIKLFTNADYWGNRLLPKKDQIGSDLYTLKNSATTPDFLKVVEGIVTAVLLDLKGTTSIESVTVKASTPVSDQVLLDIKITDVYGTEQGIIVEDINLWKQ